MPIERDLLIILLGVHLLDAKLITLPHLGPVLLQPHNLGPTVVLLPNKLVWYKENKV